jgi:adenylate cyclase
VAPEGTERRLAAILSADVVGYSRLMAEDEDETVRRLTAYRTEVTNLVADHRGRVVDFTGDNFLAEFPTATEAVEAATEIQRVIKARNAAVPAGRAMEFRIGVHLGEVRVEGERIYGDGVNIASRLEALADAGGICISEDVLHQVHRKLVLDFDDLGEQTVKNIPDPVHAYRVREAPSSEGTAPTRRPTVRWGTQVMVMVAVMGIALGIYLWTQPSLSTGPALTAIAVLPFDDMSPGGDQGWLANGMAEELIESLSRIEELQVIARTSAFALRGQDIETIGAKLNVGSVVEGSVRRAGDDLRITAQLIRTVDGTHLWSARYDRQLDDVFAIQTEIAREIAEAVRNELGIEEQWTVHKGQRYVPRDVRAYELLRKGFDISISLTEADLREGIEYFLQALEIDPDYAQAHALLGFDRLWLSGYVSVARDELLSSARVATARALELDDTNGFAHMTLATLSMGAGDFEGAERRLESALEANPGHGGVQASYAFVLAEMGQLEAAVLHARRAADLDPLLAIRHIVLGNIYLLSRNYDAAIESTERALQLSPQQPFGAEILSTAYYLKGNDTEALEVSVRHLPEGLKALETPMRRGFEEGGYQGMMRALNGQLSKLTGRPCAPDPLLSSHSHATAGDADQMYRCLEKAFAQGRSGPGLFLKTHPTWDPYRSDPRFQEMLRRRGLGE